MTKKNGFSQKTYQSLWILLAVVAIAFAARYYSFVQHTVINDDGPLYIHQARAISQGLWREAQTCRYYYISIEPFLIALIYKALGDWVVAGKIVSLIFGVLSMIPIFLIANVFFENKIAGFVAASFALNPFFVENSVDVLRGPLAWFLSLWGLYFFIASPGKSPYYLALSNLFLLVAVFSRIEMIAYIVGSYAFLLFFTKERRWTNLFFFSLPLLVTIAVSLIGVLSFTHIDFSMVDAYIIPRIKIYRESLQTYSVISAKLNQLTRTNPYSVPNRLLDQIQEVLWIVPIGLLLKKSLKVFYIPFFIITVVGARQWKKRILSQPLVMYFVIIFALFSVILYIFYITLWVISTRYLVPLVFISIPFLGFGMIRLIEVFSATHARKAIGTTLLAVLIVALALQNFKPYRTSKVIYQQIGLDIAQLSPNQEKEILIATSSGITIFYANLHKKGAPCPTPKIQYIDLVEMKNAYKIGALLKEKGIHYFLWERKLWENKPFKLYPFCGLTEVKQWRGKKNIDFILYEVTPVPGFGKSIKIESTRCMLSS
jgi:hypothetical protein